MARPYDIEQINVMAWLRFPLIMGVVLAHCNLYAVIGNWEGSNPDWPGWLIYIFNYLYWLLLPARVPTLFRQEYWSGLPCPYPGDLPDKIDNY